MFRASSPWAQYIVSTMKKRMAAPPQNTGPKITFINSKEERPVIHDYTAGFPVSGRAETEQIKATSYKYRALARTV